MQGRWGSINNIEEYSRKGAHCLGTVFANVFSREVTGKAKKKHAAGMLAAEDDEWHELAKNYKLNSVNVMQ